MSDTRGIFTLRDVLDDIIDNTYVEPKDVWIEQPTIAAPNHGMLFGNDSGAADALNKFPFATETRETISPVTTTKGRMGAVSSQYFGYFAGGYTPSPFVESDAITKISYATDTEDSVSDTLSAPKYSMASAGNIDFGVFMGGFVPGGSLSTVEKITYSTESVGLLPTYANLNLGYAFGNVAGNMVNGYHTTGWTPAGNSHVNKICYNIDTTYLLPGTFQRSSWNNTAFGNATDGYWYGGQDGGDVYSTVDKIEYSTETNSNVTNAPAPHGTRWGSGSTGGSDVGYIVGGSNPSTSSRSDGYKLTYSTETIGDTPTSGNLTFESTYISGTSARHCGFPTNLVRSATRLSDGLAETYPNKGYFFTAGAPAYTTNADKIDFASDTTTRMPGASLTYEVKDGMSIGNATDAYYAGGDMLSGRTSYVSRTNYATDTTGLTAGVMFSARYYAASASTIGPQNAGYMWGGMGNSPINQSSTCQKVSFATQTGAEVPAGVIQRGETVRGGAAAGNNTNVYIGNGRVPSPGPYTSMDKMVYSTETTSPLPSAADLSAAFTARYTAGATGNTNAGYWSGGYPGPLSLTDKLSYATDTTELLPSANLSAASRYLKGTGHKDDGYFSTSWSSILEKINYGSETFVTLPSGTISGQGRGSTAISGLEMQLMSQWDPIPTNVSRTFSSTTTPATSLGNTATGTVGSDANHGLIAGFRPGVIEKCDFTTDTTSSTNNYLQTIQRTYCGSTGNSVNGYWIGGQSPAGVRSDIEKMNYSQQISSIIPSTLLIGLGGGAPGVTNAAAGCQGNADVAYIHGYNGPGGFNYNTLVDKLTYSTDTVSYFPNILDSHAYSASAGNQTYGYIMGGQTPTKSDTIKITYSTDTISPAPSSNNPNPVTYHSGCGNSTDGYFAGGYTPSGYVSIVHKLEYSTGTVSPAPNLLENRSDAAATGDETSGYYFGAVGGAQSTMVEKVNYSTGTNLDVPGAYLTTEQAWQGASSPVEFGLPSSASIRIMGPNVV